MTRSKCTNTPRHTTGCDTFIEICSTTNLLLSLLLIIKLSHQCEFPFFLFTQIEDLFFSPFLRMNYIKCKVQSKYLQLRHSMSVLNKNSCKLFQRNISEPTPSNISIILKVDTCLTSL